MCKRWESWDIVFHLLAALQTALFRLDWIECVSSSRHFAFTFYRHVFPSIFMQCSPVRLFILRLLRSTMKCTPKSAKFFHVWHQMGDSQLLLHCWWGNKSRHSTFLTARCRDKRMKACSGSALTLSFRLVFWCHNGDAMHGNVAAHHPAVVKRMRNHNKIIQMFFSFLRISSRDCFRHRESWCLCFYMFFQLVNLSLRRFEYRREANLIELSYFA